MAKQKIGVDFHGVLDENFDLPEGAIVITGADEKEEGEEIRKALPQGTKVIFFDKQDELTDENKAIKVAAFKAKKIIELGIDKYYENEPEQIAILKELTEADIVQVLDGIALEKMSIIALTFDGSILPVAKKLKDEGNEVIVGMVDNNRNIFTDEQISNGSYKKEDPEEKRKRWKLYDGILEKQTAESLLKQMRKIKNKEDWLIIGDSNNLFRFTQDAYDMGFTKGYFPQETDRDFEENRMTAKEFVKENYPDVEVAEVKKFEAVDDAKEFLSDTDKIWVLKSLGDLGDTLCPKTEDIDQAREQITAAIESHQSDYENDGFILEEYICEPIELTPQCVYFNGKPVYYSLDIENKAIGASNSGFMTGCTQNLVVHTGKDDRINEIAFPEAVQKLADKHPGIFIWDIGLLVDKSGKMYFTEFCSNRFGWDAFPTELSMCESATAYFQKILKGIDPIESKYGAAVRILNLTRTGPVEDTEISLEDEKGIYLYDGYDNLKTVGFLDFAVCTGCGEDPYEAIQEAYDNEKKITIESKLVRPMFDFTSYDYCTAIMKRLGYAFENGLISREEDETLTKNTPSSY